MSEFICSCIVSVNRLSSLAKRRTSSGSMIALAIRTGLLVQRTVQHVLPDTVAPARGRGEWISYRPSSLVDS